MMTLRRLYLRGAAAAASGKAGRSGNGVKWVVAYATGHAVEQHGILATWRRPIGIGQESFYRDYQPGYYAAYLLDPDDDNVEALYRDVGCAGHGMGDW
jgi:hypothetical protein